MRYPETLALFHGHAFNNGKPFNTHMEGFRDQLFIREGSVVNGCASTKGFDDRLTRLAIFRKLTGDTKVPMGQVALVIEIPEDESAFAWPGIRFGSCGGCCSPCTPLKGFSSGWYDELGCGACRIPGCLHQYQADEVSEDGSILQPSLGHPTRAAAKHAASALDSEPAARETGSVWVWKDDGWESETGYSGWPPSRTHITLRPLSC